MAGGRPIPIIAGGRVTGKAGNWNIGALSITTDDDEVIQAQQTNFSVVSLRRDVLRRSVVGMMLTRRSLSTIAPGSNEVAGVEGQFQFYQNLALNTYVAKSWTSGMHGDDLSYRGQVNYNADRYGLQIDRLVVEDNFNPEVGFLRRDNFRRNYAFARFSPRPENSRLVRKYSYESGFEYTTDNHNRLESRELQGTFRIEQQNSDLWVLTYARNYELITQPFTISDGVRIPIGGYTFGTLSGSYTLGQQHRISGTATIETGSFYDGTKQTVAYKGRAQMVAGLAIEPNVSLNWIDIPQGTLHQHRRRWARDLHGDASHVRRRPGAVQLEHDIAVDQHPVSVGVPAGQRTVRRVHGGTGHPSSASHRSGDAWADGEDQPPLQVLSGRP